MTASYYDLSEAPAPPWGPDDEWLECVRVRDETHDVRSFVFRPVQARTFRYRPGQFITLRLDIDGEPVHRCYTLCSSPTRPDTVTITVKRVPGGRVSNWLHDHMRPGQRLSVTGPAGSFCFPPGPVLAPARGQLYLSGGSGITPLMSMSRAWSDLGLDVDVQFIHAARTPQDIVFAHELELLARTLPRWRATLVCEGRGDTPGYCGLLGRLNLALLHSQVPDFLEREVWCCGPAPFMGAVRNMLAEAGFDMARYREESFSFESLVPDTAAGAAPPAAPATHGARQFAITLKSRGERFECSADETILQAAQRAGVRWPFSCSSGMCGTCRTRKLTGEIEMHQNGGLRPREVAQGWMLPCCSKPLTDIELDR
ncbi:FAD-binding oxidoreductase [Schlegelella sp. S2-27]|uniref:FAD-binding oxidoreductase n=1 Tax=Caldimonas mangrovi TaxID=2944811 RepID=A0ABT0YP68_9BURK|nr:hybrid-cluster NAD(P)-dependent oxidoreductase [Caldimonas mangrovi]MCM5680527.1 FAD-binding oxidoreductase [Caldimonas mangrovi]